MRRYQQWLIIILAVALIVFSILWTKFQWNECRKESESIWFCLQHVS